MLTVADIYCGAGGLSAGFSLASIANASGAECPPERFQVAYGLDHNCDAIRSFRHFHFRGVDETALEIVSPCKDIKDVTSASILAAMPLGRQVDVLIGGPNCQGVSAAGLRNPDDDRNEML